MSDVIQPASTGRAKCRGCGRSIAAKTLRFGEAQASAYGEGESLSWFHLPCAACLRPEKLLAALEAGEAFDVPDRTWIEGAARAGLQNPRLTQLTRVERAASGRARCRTCHDLIEKGELRLALQALEDGRFSAAGTVHVQCAEATFGTADIVDRLRHLQDLEPAIVPELERALAEQRTPPPGDAPPSDVAHDGAGIPPTTRAPETADVHRTR